MEIIWQVDDGYAGGRRPHTTEIDDDDILSCATEEELQDLIEACIYEDFLNQISYSVLEGLDKTVRLWKEKNADLPD